MPQLGRIILYVRDIDAAAAFYELHFGFTPTAAPGDRIVELVNPDGGANIMLHQAAKGVRHGQSTVKLVFDVADVAAFCEAAAQKDLRFGAIHKGGGYSFANAKDPDGNSVSVSGRALREAQAASISA